MEAILNVLGGPGEVCVGGAGRGRKDLRERLSLRKNDQQKEINAQKSVFHIETKFPPHAPSSEAASSVSALIWPSEGIEEPPLGGGAALPLAGAMPRGSTSTPLGLRDIIAGF